MQLGNILSTAKSPVCCRQISFQVLGEGPDGRQVSAKAEASLAFVDEDKREEYKFKARDYLEAHEYKNRPVPRDVLDEEEYRWFLMAALRNKDDEAQQFCPNDQYSLFRKALIVEQIGWLMKSYREFVKDEYGEFLTPGEQAALAEKAAGK